MPKIELPRSALWQPPPSWLVPGSEEPIPQPIVEFHARALDGRAMLAEAGTEVAALLALPQVLDTPWVLDPLKVNQLGYAGMIRYMCADQNTGPGSSLPQKRPTYDEVQRQLDAGLDFWWNYEDGADDYNDGYAAWFAKGQHAADFGVNVLKLPEGMGCYGSCDMDVGLQPTHTQLESQRGFRDGYQPLGPAGVYGSTVMINAVADAGTSRFGWITLAKSWNHGVLTDPGYGHLDQVGQAFNGSADTNNQLQALSGSYLQATQGGFMPALTDAQQKDLYNDVQAIRAAVDGYLANNTIVVEFDSDQGTPASGAFYVVSPGQSTTWVQSMNRWILVAPYLKAAGVKTTPVRIAAGYANDAFGPIVGPNPREAAGPVITFAEAEAAMRDGQRS
jgi:hypothetical protein